VRTFSKCKARFVYCLFLGFLFEHAWVPTLTLYPTHKELAKISNLFGKHLISNGVSTSIVEATYYTLHARSLEHKMFPHVLNVKFYGALCWVRTLNKVVLGI
jgi:hypothetical protein